MQKTPDGHVLLDGARWHYPAPGNPTACAVPGCERVIGEAARRAARDAALADVAEPELETEPETAGSA